MVHYPWEAEVGLETSDEAHSIAQHRTASLALVSAPLAWLKFDLD